MSLVCCCTSICPADSICDSTSSSPRADSTSTRTVPRRPSTALSKGRAQAFGARVVARFPDRALCLTGPLAGRRNMASKISRASGLRGKRRLHTYPSARRRTPWDSNTRRTIQWAARETAKSVAGFELDTNLSTLAFSRGGWPISHCEYGCTGVFSCFFMPH